MATPALITLGYLNRGRFGTWTASTEVPTLPAANLADPVRTNVWRSASVSNQWIKCQLQAALPVSLPTLVHSNLTLSATVRIQASATDSWSPPSALDEVFDVWDQTRTKVLLKLLTPIAPLWWRWTLHDPTNPDGYLEVGVGVLTPSVTFVRGPHQVRITRVDPSVSGISAGQTPRAWSLPKRWRVQWLQRQITAAVLYGSLFDAYDALGTSEDGVLSVCSSDPDADALAKGTNVYGRLDTSPEAVFSGPPDVFQEAMSFLESR